MLRVGRILPSCTAMKFSMITVLTNVTDDTWRDETSDEICTKKIQDAQARPVSYGNAWLYSAGNLKTVRAQN